MNFVFDGSTASSAFRVKTGQPPTEIQAARSGYRFVPDAMISDARTESSLMSYTSTTVIPGCLSITSRTPCRRRWRLTAPRLVIIAILPFPLSIFTASSPMIRPAATSSTPQYAARFDLGASASHVTTGMPASTARLMVSVRKSPLRQEMAMPSTRCVMNDSRISFWRSWSATSGPRQMTSTFPSSAAARSAPTFA